MKWKHILYIYVYLQLVEHSLRKFCESLTLSTRPLEAAHAPYHFTIIKLRHRRIRKHKKNGKNEMNMRKST